jgi:hypothetical protein
MRQPRSCRSNRNTSAVAIIGRRAAHFAVKAEHRDAISRIEFVGRLDHVVLLVALEPVLRPKALVTLTPAAISASRLNGSGFPSARRDGRQRDTLAFQRLPQCRFRQQAIYAVLHAAPGGRKSMVKQDAS